MLTYCEVSTIACFEERGWSRIAPGDSHETTAECGLDLKLWDALENLLPVSPALCAFWSRTRVDMSDCVAS